ETDIGLDKIDVVAGGETAGIPYASFVSHLIQKPMIYIRKQPKGYGGTKQIEGILEPGQRVMLVEDLITDGLSKLRFNIGIRGAGAKMTTCLCVFDYASDRLNQHEGKMNLARNGIEPPDRRVSQGAGKLGAENGIRVNAGGRGMFAEIGRGCEGTACRALVVFGARQP